MDDQRRTKENAARRTAAMGVIGAFMLLSPVLPQILNIKSAYIRQWTMFSGVGSGVLKGDFTVTDADGGETRYTPLQVLGLNRYPVGAQFYRFDSLIAGDDDITRIAAQFCDEHVEDGGDLSFSGRLGEGKAWRRIDISGLCDGDGL